MEFNMMAGYGDYNWSLILWLFIGILLFVVIVSIIVRKVNKKRNDHQPRGKTQRDVIKERRARGKLTEDDNKVLGKNSKE